MISPLQSADELRCPHCQHWHSVTLRHTDGTDYTRAMLYWTCKGRSYYAGQLGIVSRHPTRPSDSSIDLDAG